MIDPEVPVTDDQHAPPPEWRLAMAEIKAKLDVALAQHGAQLQDHERRLASGEQIGREHDARITANALTIAETREQVRSATEGIKASRSSVMGWAGIGVAVLAVLLSPLLSFLLTR